MILVYSVIVEKWSSYRAHFWLLIDRNSLAVHLCLNDVK